MIETPQPFRTIARVAVAGLCVVSGTVTPFGMVVLGHQFLGLSRPGAPAFLFPLVLAVGIALGIFTAAGMWLAADHVLARLWRERRRDD